MLVLHGFWLPEPGLCLWAEDSELLVKSPSQAYRSARPDYTSRHLPSARSVCAMSM